MCVGFKYRFAIYISYTLFYTNIIIIIFLFLNFTLLGTCMYSVQSHDGAVLGLTCSASYVISIGQDDKICVWDRFHGHQLNSIQIVRFYF